MENQNKNKRPATFGGTGFSRRNIVFRKEMGQIWTRCGVQSEGEPLRQIVLAEPGPEMNVVEPPNHFTG